MIKQMLLAIFDRISMESLGHSYRWLQWQREQLRQAAEVNEIKNRLAAAVVLRLREDLNAPDEAGW